MALYQYIDDRDNKIYDLIQGMNDEHIAFAPDGYKLQRIWNRPAASIDSKLNPDSAQDFIKYTSTRKGKYGELLDLSKELSEKRKDKHGGYDEVEVKANENYKKSHRGKDMPHIKKQKLKESLKNSAFEIDI